MRNARLTTDQAALDAGAQAYASSPVVDPSTGIKRDAWLGAWLGEQNLTTIKTRAAAMAGGGSTARGGDLGAR